MSMGGSKSSGSSSITTTSPLAKILAQFGTSVLPIAKQLNSQIGESLRTGGVNAEIPIVSRSLDAARSAFSGSYENTRQALARSGFSGSGFGQQVLSDLGIKGNMDIARIPADAASQFIGMAPGQESLGVGALSTAAGFDVTTRGSFNNSLSDWSFDPGQFISDLGTGAEGAAKAGLI